MNAQTPDQLFYLKSLAALLRGYTPPAGPFDPSGEWEQCWRVCTLTGEGGQVGNITITRTPTSEGASFFIAIGKRLEAGAAYTIDARVEARVDSLATPRTWHATAISLTAQIDPVAGSRLEVGGSLRDGWLSTTGVGKQERTRPLEGPCTLDWLLFDAIQRLPAAPGEPLGFTMIKDFDQPRPGQRLEFRESLRVQLGGRELALDAFHQTGEGVLPVIYYRDAQGRLLFVVSGLEGYILE